MKLELHLGSKIVRPPFFDNVAAVKIFNDSYQLLAIAMEQGPGFDALDHRPAGRPPKKGGAK
jgi:hypothetical protein